MALVSCLTLSELGHTTMLFDCTVHEVIIILITSMFLSIHIAGYDVGTNILTAIHYLFQPRT